MGKKKDLYDIYGLDRNNQQTRWFVEAVGDAKAELSRVVKEGREPALAFGRFVEAWEAYAVMPDYARCRCGRLLEWFRTIWEDVVGSEASRFCDLCRGVANGREELAEELNGLCLELIEAVVLLDGDLPYAGRFYFAAQSALFGRGIVHEGCLALLPIFCGRICSWTFEMTENAEQLLAEGVKAHMAGKASGTMAKSEPYAMQIAAAIHEIISNRLEKGIIDEYVVELVKEGYSVLEPFNSSSADWARANLNERTGIPADYALDDNNWSRSLLNYRKIN